MEEKKGIVDQEKTDLLKKEEESAKELEDIKNMVENKKDDIIDYIIHNVMNVNMEFPEMVKKDLLKKRKVKNKNKNICFNLENHLILINYRFIK